MATMKHPRQFNNLPNEFIYAFLSRFLPLHHRTQQPGGDLAITREGYTWLLLCSCGINQHKLIAVPRNCILLFLTPPEARKATRPQGKGSNPTRRGHTESFGQRSNRSGKAGR